MKRRWMLVGSDEVSKRKIAEIIENKTLDKRNNIDVLYRDKTMEVSGLYLENSYLNNIIIILGQNHAKANLFIMEANQKSHYPPLFSKSFTKPTAVIITKSEKLNQNEREEIYKQALKIGSEKIIYISFKTQEGLDELKEYIEKIEGASNDIYN